ncbi:MAG: enoyl-CoA hydratase/isomerase family protein [Deltaproteobacteria bacterium]|nr:enoyl-CoA hydratase/isomerase family protein [Deltaproteobacteria bacterium]
MSPRYANLTLEFRGLAALITIDRPHALNALDTATLEELDDALSEAADHDDIRALILTGAGSKAFVAGADIAQMREFTVAEAEDFSLHGQSVLDGLSGFPAPVIAAVNGYALGGGTEIAVACDLILCSANAVFGQPEVGLGVIPGFGGTQRLTRLVGPMRAREIVFTGRRIPAAEAVQIGLALRVVEGDVVEAAMELATVIARQGPVAVRLAKRAINENADAALATALAAERTLFAHCFATNDQDEGMAAFLEKRKAVFRGA